MVGFVSIKELQPFFGEEAGEVMSSYCDSLTPKQFRKFPKRQSKLLTSFQNG